MLEGTECDSSDFRRQGCGLPDSWLGLEVVPHTAKTQTKRGQQRVHDIERTGQRFLSVLEKETERRFSALFKHLNVVSRQEVRGLLRRVAQLEERLTRSDERGDHEVGHLTHASTSLDPHMQKTSLRRYAEFLWDEV